MRADKKWFINPWSPKVRIQGVSSKVRSKLTTQEKSIFPRIINKTRQIFRLEISYDFTIYHDYQFHKYAN